MSTSTPSEARLVHLISPRSSVAGLPRRHAVAPRGVVVWVLGDLDADTADHLLAGLARICDARRTGPVVLDLSRLTFLDSAGLRVLMELRRRLATHGRSLPLRNVTIQAQLVLSAGGCLELFDFECGDSAFDDPA